MNMHLFVNSPDVSARGGKTNPQSFCDLFDEITIHQQFQYFPFTRRELIVHPLELRPTI